MIKQLGTVLLIACMMVIVLPVYLFATTSVETKIDTFESHPNRTKVEYLKKLADKQQKTISALSGSLTNTKRQMALNQIDQTYTDTRNAIHNADSADEIVECYHNAIDRFDLLLAVLELQPINLATAYPARLHRQPYPSYFAFMSMMVICMMSLISLSVLAVKYHKSIKKHHNYVEKADMLINLSQIKQHFVCNSLISMKHLYELEPAKAATAMDHFIFYVRENLYSLTGSTLIYFTKEWKHVQDYLYLEQLRFGDRLLVEWDIRFVEYQLPPLSLQTIVENAIRHGINQKEEGGTIMIRSVKENGYAILTVIDTGAGFDTSTMPNGSCQHIGLDNVRKRLTSQCGGSLDIQSQPGVGTTVRISLPVANQSPAADHDSHFVS